MTASPPGPAAALERLIRRVIPSVPPLTYNRAVAWALDALDLPWRLLVPEFRRLPPNHMRVRVGVGWRLFTNHVSHLRQGEWFWMFVLARGWAGLNSVIVDLGSGCGRYAHHLRDYEFKGEGFSGTYIGVDIDEEMLDWCRRNFPSGNFRFHRSTHASQTYAGGGGGRYVVPEPDGSVDFVFSTSLFTHLLEGEMENYLEESCRLLRDGGVMAANCFVIDMPSPTMGGRHTFRHAMGNARVESLRRPEAAVAYPKAHLIACARRAGFVDVEILAGRDDWQPMLVGRKPLKAASSVK